MFKQYLKSINIFLIIISIIFSGCSSSFEKTIKSNNVSAATEVKKTSNQLSIGIGLSRISDWSTQFPFLDHFKTARAWIPQCIKSEPNCERKWGTGENDLLDSESKQGRDVINVDSGKKNGILMTITSTDPNKTGDYIRFDISVAIYIC